MTAGVSNPGLWSSTGSWTIRNQAAEVSGEHMHIPTRTSSGEYMHGCSICMSGRHAHHSHGNISPPHPTPLLVHKARKIGKLWSLVFYSIGEIQSKHGDQSQAHTHKGMGHGFPSWVGWGGEPGMFSPQLRNGLKIKHHFLKLTSFPPRKPAVLRMLVGLAQSWSQFWIKFCSQWVTNNA